MIAMTGGALVRYTTLRAVASDTGLPGGKNDVRGLTAAARVVAGGTSDFEMFSMIESGANEPANRDNWMSDLRHLGS